MALRLPSSSLYPSHFSSSLLTCWAGGRQVVAQAGQVVAQAGREGACNMASNMQALVQTAKREFQSKQ